MIISAVAASDFCAGAIIFAVSLAAAPCTRRYRFMARDAVSYFSWEGQGIKKFLTSPLPSNTFSSDLANYFLVSLNFTIFFQENICKKMGKQLIPYFKWLPEYQRYNQLTYICLCYFHVSTLKQKSQTHVTLNQTISKCKIEKV